MRPESGCVLESRSALAAVLPASGHDGADGRRRLRLGEAPLGSLVQIGVYPGGEAIVEMAAHTLPTEALPVSAVAAVRLDGSIAFRIAADQYWIRSFSPSLAVQLRALLPEHAASVTPLEGSRTCILIEGPAARSLLGRLVAVDVDSERFGIGHFAQVPIHHVGGLLYRVGSDCYEFIALRTFAASTFEVIEDAARFYGYDICEGT
jgi:heterotetrameric sarcosine oxidase gamma subunit